MSMRDGQRRNRASAAAVEDLEQRRLFSSSLNNGLLTVTGTSGNDIISLRLSGDVFTVAEGNTNTNYSYAQITSINVDGGDGNDTITVAASITKPATLLGGVGNDNLAGGNGSDYLSGGDGDDTLMGRLGADTLYGDAGTDTVTYADRNTSGASLSVTLDDNNDDGAAGEADNVHADIENVIGGAGNDYIAGSAGANSLNGGAGSDTILGGAGNDTLISGTGADNVDGGDGIDTLDFSTVSANLKITLDDVANDYAGFNGENFHSTIEIVIGTSYADSIVGGANNETLIGGSNNDTLIGGAGDDSLDGGQGSDSLDGGDGNDTLVGGTQADTLIGGDGSDTFVAGGDNAVDTLYVQLGIDAIQSADATDIINYV